MVGRDTRVSQNCLYMHFDMDKVVSEALHRYNDKVTLRFGLSAERFSAAKMEIYHFLRLSLWEHHNRYRL